MTILNLENWLCLFQIVVVSVLVIGFIQTYVAIKRKYKDEIEANKKCFLFRSFWY